METPGVLYFSRSLGLHDRRFLERIRRFGCPVWFLGVTPAAVPEALPPDVTPLAFSRRYVLDDPGDRRAMARELAALAAAVRPDVIHAGPVHDCGHIAALAGVRPLVVMSWGSDLLLDAPSDPVVRDAARTALAACDGFCCDCRTVAQAAAALTDMAGKPCALFPWGTDCRAFRPRGEGDAVPLPPDWAGAKVVLSLRSFEPVYGIDTVLSAFALAQAREASLRLLLPGDGSLVPLVRRRVAAEGLEGLVLLPGRIPSPELPPYYRAADVYLSASHSDGSSVSLLEAMASGLPAVVSDLPANREWVEEGRNGWLAPVDQPARFAEGLVRAVRLGAGARAAMAGRNRERALADADWEANTMRLFDLYRRLAADLA